MKTTLKQLFMQTTDSNAAMIIRIVLGLIIFPHGAQHLLGWFGGFGYSGFMNWLITEKHLPWIVAFLVVQIEFFGSLLLIAGLATRFVSALTIVLFIGIILASHLQFGFFMDWLASMPGEGYEFHLLIIGMCLSLLISGGGKYSVDWFIGKKSHS